MTIDLGSFITVGGQTVGNGISSGLDTQAIIDSLIEVRQVSVTNLEDDITFNNSQVTAFSELRSSFETLRTNTNFLRNPSGFNAASSNIFEFRSTSSVHSNASLLASNFVSVSASPGATLGAYDVAIGTLATAKEERSDAFTSQSISVTEAAGGTTSGLFSAGTFDLITTQTLTSSTSSITNGFFGTGDGVTVSSGAPIVDIVAGNDPTVLLGGVASVTALVDGVNIDITLTLNNGAVFVANDVPANTGGGSDSVAAGEITFVNTIDSTSTFDVNNIATTVIGGIQANADAFATALNTGLSGVTLSQQRQLSNFDTSVFTGTTLSGLSSSHIIYNSDSYETSGDIGDIGKITVTGVSTPGAGDGSISVVINGETFTASSLGDDAGDTEDDNITLTSGTTDKTLQINLATAGVSFDFSSTGVDTLEDLLNRASPAKVGEVTLEEGDSLVEVADAINSVSSLSGVTANILQVGESDFRLTLQSDTEGLENAYTISDSANVTSQVNFTTTQSAGDASFKVDGISISRSTNTIADVVSGVTFNLLATTADFGGGGEESVATTISRDIDTVELGITNFLDAYNAFRVFEAEQTQRDEDGAFTEDAVLQNDSTLRALVNQLNTQVTRVVGNTSNTLFARLADVGIDLADFAGDSETVPTSNILTLDSTELRTALTNNFEDVRDIFEFGFTATSNTLNVFSRTNDTTLENFQVDIDTGRAVGNQVRILDTSGSFLFNADLAQDASGNYTITGQANTTIEGLVLLYTGDGTDVITANLSFGIADGIYNIVDEALDENDGIIQLAVDALLEAEENLEEDIERLQATIDRERELLEAQFVALETAITEVNTLLDFLDAQSASIFGTSD